MCPKVPTEEVKGREELCAHATEVTNEEVIEELEKAGLTPEEIAAFKAKLEEEQRPDKSYMALPSHECDGWADCLDETLSTAELEVSEGFAKETAKVGDLGEFLDFLMYASQQAPELLHGVDRIERLTQAFVTAAQRATQHALLGEETADKAFGLEDVNMDVEGRRPLWDSLAG